MRVEVAGCEDLHRDRHVCGLVGVVKIWQTEINPPDPERDSEKEYAEQNRSL